MTDVPVTNTKHCSIKILPQKHWIGAAARAIKINPRNDVASRQLRQAAPNVVIKPEHLALLTTKYWGSEGVHLTVGFLDDAPDDLKQKILLHMNAWSQFANVQFSLATENPQVRISRTRGDGYWSYLGTDILSSSIRPDEPTMNLEDFSMATPDSEFHRVVRHETGHTLGFPHEHMRTEIIQQIDRDKAIAYFQRTQGWSEQEVIDQVLTPLDMSVLDETDKADENSIMCYWLPAEIMKTNVAVSGGKDIDNIDAEFAAKVYPKKIVADKVGNTNITVAETEILDAKKDQDLNCATPGCAYHVHYQHQDPIPGFQLTKSPLAGKQIYLACNNPTTPHTNAYQIKP